MIPFLLILLSSAVSLTEGILIKKRNSVYDKEGFCFTAIVSFFLFRERFSKRQLVGVAIGTAALILLQF